MAFINSFVIFLSAFSALIEGISKLNIPAIIPVINAASFTLLFTLTFLKLFSNISNVCFNLLDDISLCLRSASLSVYPSLLCFKAKSFI